MKNIIFTALAALALTACGSADSEKKVEVVKTPLVKVATTVQQPVEQIATYTGSIEPFAKNNISPSLGLRINKINADVGDHVRRGQLLVEMDRRQYLQSATQTSTLETDFMRMQKLYEEGGVSKQQLDQLESQLTVSRHATSNLLENSELVSPITGVVTDRTFDPGDIYSPATGRILTIMQIDKVKVQVNVSEQYFTKVKLGMTVDIKLDLYPSTAFAGRVSLIYPALDASTRTFTIEITIDNGGNKLRPGMFCRVSLNLGKVDRVLVPDIAVHKQVGTDERYIFVVKDGAAERQVVTIGQLVGKNYEILSGATVGEQVVIAGGQKLLDGEKVDIVK
ncbi:MAG: efflux RND transporter periplasmic adaptor subunit [Mucinivorans sp.]